MGKNITTSGGCFCYNDLMKNLPSQNYFKNKRVLLRVDFNVEQSKGKVLDDFRIRRTLPTIKYLQKTCSKLILASHMTDEKESLAPIAKHLSKLLKKRVYFIQENIVSAKKLIDSLPQKSVVLLENLRFDKGEKENSFAFGKNLANLADVFVQDAFGEAHRKVASMTQTPKLLPSFAGFNLQNELKHLDKLKAKPSKPFVVILGGAKLKTKLPLIKSFIKKADYILLGGGIANTFLKAQGLDVGKSLYEKDFVRQAKKLLKHKNIILPGDYLVAPFLKSKTVSRFSVIGYPAQSVSRRIQSGRQLSVDNLILDVGPESSEAYSQIISSAKTVLWNGPMGYYENPVFARATFDVAKAVLANKKAFKIIGGGDTTAFLRKANTKLETLNSKFFISTGGGAMLEYLSGKKLPGVVALE